MSNSPVRVDAVNSLSGDIDRLEDRLRGLAWWQKAIALDTVSVITAPRPWMIFNYQKHFQIAALGVQLGGAKIGLGIANGALTVVLDVMRSALFQDLKDTWNRASEAVDTVKKKVDLAIDYARDQLNNARKIFEALELTLNGEFEKAEQKARSMVDEAQRLYNDYETRQALESEKLQLQLQALKNSAVSTAVTAAERALEVAKNNNIAFKAAQAGLDAIKAVEDTLFHTLDSLIKAAASLCDIRVIKLKGTITANPKEQSAFIMHVEGALVGQNFNFDVEYVPGQTVEFLERLAVRAVNHLSPS